jgi:hypothetical protein
MHVLYNNLTPYTQLLSPLEICIVLYFCFLSYQKILSVFQINIPSNISINVSVYIFPFWDSLFYALQGLEPISFHVDMPYVIVVIQEGQQRT